MARAFLLAMGISACILGAECMALDHFALYGGESPTAPLWAGDGAWPRCSALGGC